MCPVLSGDARFSDAADRKVETTEPPNYRFLNYAPCRIFLWSVS